MKSIFRYVILASVLLIAPLLLRAQTASSGSVILDEYVQEGLQNNLALRQETLEISRITESLQQARSLFYPRVAFAPTYSLAAGGRRLQFPIGDLVNPIYNTLNRLTGQQQFPTNLANVNELLAPNNFHDTKISVQYALFNTDIRYNYLIQKGLISVQEARKQVVQNDVRYAIQTAYYQYLQTLEGLRILDNARNTLRELIRLNEKLVANNVATKETVTQARYELSKLDQQVAVARRNRESASAYLNFLLNRDLTAPVAVDSTLLNSRPGNVPAQVTPLPDLQLAAGKHRQEINQLTYSLAAAQTAVKLNEANAAIPHLFVGGNAGFQGFSYSFAQQAYAVVQLGLQWDLFRGYEKKAKIRQAKIQTDVLQTRLLEAEKQIQLQVIQAYYDLEAARESLVATQTGAANAEQTFRILDSKYRNGQALLIEFLRVQNDRLTAQLQQSLAQMDVLTKQAALNRAVSLN